MSPDEVTKVVAIFLPVFCSINWAVVLFLKNNKVNKARILLGIFMLINFLFYLGTAFYFLGWWHTYAHYDPVSDFSKLSFFPLYYLYIRLLTVDKNWNPAYLFHFLPAFAYGMTTLIAHYVYHDVSHENSEQDFIDNLFSLNIWNQPLVYVIVLERIFFALQLIFYVIFSVRLIITHHQRVRNFYSYMGDKDIQWVSLLLYSFLGAALIGFLFNLTGRSVLLSESGFLLIPSVLCTVLIFVIGYVGNAQNQVVMEIRPEKEGESDPGIGLTGQMLSLQEKLEKLFQEDKIFLRPELTIWDVSMELATNRTYVSQLINDNYGMNFSRFVNQYRVEQAKELLKNREMDHLSLESIGEQCGFGTLNNFIRVFRLFENTTPGKYREILHYYAS